VTEMEIEYLLSLAPQKYNREENGKCSLLKNEGICEGKTQEKKVKRFLSTILNYTLLSRFE
jgi:hypothetical protein